MKKEFIVGLEDNRISYIKTGTFILGTSEESLITEMCIRDGYDYTRQIEKLEKIIIGLLRRNQKDEEYIKEVMGEQYLEGVKEYFSNSVIKARTEKEKEELIQKIREDKY